MSPAFLKTIRLPALALFAAATAFTSGLPSLAHAEDDAPPMDTAPPPGLAPEPPAEPPPPPGADIAAPAESEETPSLGGAGIDEPLAERPVLSGEETVSAPTSDERQQNVIAARKQGHVPYYQTIRPNWGVQLTGSLAALGGEDIEEHQGGAIARAVQIQAEYQPAFLQSLGVIGVGPSFSIIPIGSGVTTSPASIWAIGGAVRYQARYFREQPVVPMAGFEGQYMFYRFTDGKQGATLLTGPVFGGMVLLNFLEPTSAAELYIEDGICRTYLLAEYKMLLGDDQNISVGGGSLFFGLRFEF